MAGLSLFLDLELALDELGDQLRKGKPAIFRHFDARPFDVHRDVEVGGLAFSTGCHMAHAVRHIYAVNKNLLFPNFFLDGLRGVSF
jgi:hypothetical protein